MKELLNKTVAVNDTIQIGVPFGKSYYKPTPKFWRMAGDALMTLGTLSSILGIKHPAVAVICGVAGWLGKIITNSISTK